MKFKLVEKEIFSGEMPSRYGRENIPYEVHVNPSPEDLNKYIVFEIRGYVNENGDLYVLFEIDSGGVFIHRDLLNILKDIVTEPIVDSPSQVGPGVCVIQEGYKSNTFTQSESVTSIRKEGKEEEINKILELFKKAKQKNPRLNFEIRN